VPVHIVLSGAEAFGMGWETWIDIDRKTLRCQGLRFTCLNDMRQPQAVFGLRTGGRLELEDCVVTMAGSRDAVLGACVLVKEWVRPSSLLTGEGRGSQTSSNNGTTTPATDIATDSMPMPATAMPTAMPTTSMPTAMPLTLMPATSTPSPMPTIASSSVTDTGSPARSSDETLQGGALDSDSEPVSISISRSIMRGAQSLISMRSVCRAEISIENVCAMLEGRALTIRATEDSRMPPVIRMNLQQSTLVCQQGFAAVQATQVSRVPLTLMRTAKLCAFWSPSSVPHIAIDGIDSQDVLDKLLLLRGEENAYDQNIETLCQCRFSDGQHIDYSLRDSMGEWFRELGNENILRWQGSVPPERAMEDQFPEDYRVRESMFMPGYREP
ncbi:MAG: hypothetical protein IT423_14925, partial [Pirellulaceae bacterium]|nr:hypothetical protein [Pirellulaceae bacterium]